MAKKVTLKRYEYPLKDKKGEIYYGAYTIRKGVKPMGFEGERLVKVFDYEVLEKGERL